MTITITIRKNGALYIHPDEVAQVRLVDHEGNEVKPPGRSITLCRCGDSKNKPFCDSSHNTNGFDGCGPLIPACAQVEHAPAADGTP